MLRTLGIENYGLIERAEIAFASGATMFTGETGSGKTMLLGALGFVLGERAAAERGARTVVTLTYELDGTRHAIERELTAGGKSSIKLDGQTVTAATVRELVSGIADIIGQHDAQRLLSPKYHLELLDRFGGETLLATRDRATEFYATLQAIETRLNALEGDERRARARYEDARYALEEIEAAAIPAPVGEVWEDVRLTERRKFLDNIERVAEALRIAHDALTGDEGNDTANVTAASGAAQTALYGIAGIAATFSTLADRAAALQEEANDLARDIARELETTEFNPSELEEINARLDQLDRLKRKYGGSLSAVVAYADTARTTVADFDGRDERLIELRSQRETTRGELTVAAGLLTAKREEAAKKLAQLVDRELKDLALTSARFDVAFETLDDIGPTGAENAEFTFSANAGEPLRPLIRVASGGELSRVLLALVVVLSQPAKGKAAHRQTLVFDEIDAGIGGATATTVAARLGRLAERDQIVCVTHLAQIASYADKHYVLEKSEKKNTTTIAVRELTTVKEREAELARMLSGETHEVALKHARSLLKAGKN